MRSTPTRFLYTIMQTGHGKIQDPIDDGSRTFLDTANEATVDGDKHRYLSIGEQTIPDGRKSPFYQEMAFDGVWDRAYIPIEFSQRGDRAAGSVTAQGKTPLARVYRGDSGVYCATTG